MSTSTQPVSAVLKVSIISYVNCAIVDGKEHTTNLVSSYNSSFIVCVCVFIYATYRSLTFTTFTLLLSFRVNRKSLKCLSKYSSY